jgi:hypothetical protein
MDTWLAGAGCAAGAGGGGGSFAELRWNKLHEEENAVNAKVAVNTKAFMLLICRQFSGPVYRSGFLSPAAE